MNSFAIIEGTWNVVLAQAGATLDQGQPLNVPGTPGGEAATGTGTSTGQPGGQPAGGTNQPQPGLPQWFPLVMVFFVLLIFMTSMGGRKDRKRQATMLAGLTKQDKVKTSGGIIGTIIEIHGDEIVIRTDEASNTRIRFSRSSVQQILKPSRDRGLSDDSKDLGTMESKPNETATI